MCRRSLVLLTLALVLSACSAAPSATIAPALAAFTPSAALLATSHALNDTPILEATPTRQPATPAQSTPRQAARNTAPPATPVAKVPARPSIPVRIVIEDLDMDQPLLAVGVDSGRNPVVPKHEAGWYEGSAVPGQGENIVLWGHALRFRDSPDIPAPFGRLKDLTTGARVVLLDQHGGRHSYTVTRQVWATPDQVEYILPQGEERITMVSCIGDKVMTDAGLTMTHRLITIAEPREG